MRRRALSIALVLLGGTGCEFQVTQPAPVAAPTGTPAPPSITITNTNTNTNTDSSDTGPHVPGAHTAGDRDAAGRGDPLAGLWRRRRARGGRGE